MEKFLEEQYRTKLYSLYEKNAITKEQLDHFLKRGLQILNIRNQFNLDSLSNILPYIIIGASKSFIDKLSIPYQATSYVAAETYPESGRYIYKIPGIKRGGVRHLTGGKRKFGDNLYASTHKILIGFEAILSSIYNLVENKEQTWEWTFYANHFQQSSPDLYEDLCKLNNIYNNQNSSQYFIVVARNSKSFQRSGIIEAYLKHQIKIFNQLSRKIIFLTDQSGYDYCSKIIRESNDILYVTTGKEFNIVSGLSYLKKKYNIKLILNDGGRIMSNSLKENGVIGEERITLEPYPGKEFLDFNKNDFLLQDYTLGIKGSGLDGSEINDAIMVNSTKIRDEIANVYVYPLENI
jgi:riboflavin biosynthesis pyrimidine reductase